LGLFRFCGSSVRLIGEGRVTALRGQRCLGAPIACLHRDHCGLGFEMSQILLYGSSRSLRGTPLGIGERSRRDRVVESGRKLIKVMIENADDRLHPADGFSRTAPRENGAKRHSF
jgi:hypothetical protein